MKKAIKLIIFLVLFAFAYSTVNGVLETKTTDGNGRMVIYKALPEDTVDVLMIGSSHIGMNIDTSLLWDEYGIAAYTLWSGMQPVVDSYYFLKEAITTQKPKVVVLEVFLSAFDTGDYSYTTVMKSVLALPYGLNKWNAAVHTAATWQEAMEMFWGMPVYHTRYAELTKDDFTFSKRASALSLSAINEDIIAINTNNYPVSLLDYAHITDTLPLTAQNEMYLKKCAELCAAQGISLVFLVSPFEATKEEAMRLNSVGVLAKAYGVDYLNYLTQFDETGLVASEDFFDVGHLNAIGIPKYTTVFGDYLSEHYSLPDRRMEQSHIWNTAAGEHTEAAAYTLTEQFAGDGVRESVDTGVKLYENRYGSWTLLARLDTQTYGDDEVYLSCFSEDAALGNYGLLLRKKTNGRLSLRLGGNIETEVPYDGETIDLAVIKEGQTYTVFANGTKILDQRELPCASYSGTLLLGCEELGAGGERFRFSRTHISNLEVYDSVLSDAVIKSWSPSVLPSAAQSVLQSGDSPALLWSLPEQFTKDASNYIRPRYYDTKTALYETTTTCFTLVTEVTAGLSDAGNVYYSCFSEDTENYRGLLLRQTEENMLDLLLGSVYTCKIPCTDGEKVCITVTKDVSSYCVYVNGEVFAENLLLPCDAYEGTLLIGCQTDANGELFRFSDSEVNALYVYSGILPQEEIAGVYDAETPLPKTRVASKVEYHLDYAYMGNALDAYVDTGIKLYDVPQKDWTLETEITANAEKPSGVFLSCFSEEQGAYRGFMIRQSDESLTFFVGNAASKNISLSSGDKKLHIVIAKQGDRYLICVNGEKVLDITSACDAYDGTLLVGAQRDAEEKLFRFSTARVNSLSISDGALPDEDALALSKQTATNNRF